MKRLLALLLFLALACPAGAATKTIDDLDAASIATGDELAFWDISAVGTSKTRKITFGDFKTALSLQPLDSDLTSIAALTTTTFGRSLLETADAAALRTAGGLVIGTNVQAYSATLSALATNTGTVDLSGLTLTLPADVTRLGSSISLTSEVAGTLPVANGGTGTTTPALVAGSNITITGTWPNQTIAADGGTITIGRQLRVDSVNGNDSTGTRGRMDLPYLTLAEAKADAQSGDIILVGPGSYTATASILKDGVNWNFAAGATVTMDAGDNAVVVGPLGDVVGITSTVTGAGTFVVDATGRAGATEVTTFNCATATGFAGGEYVSLYGSGNARFNFWFRIDGAGSAPGPGGTDVEIALGAGYSAADLSAALAAAITANAGSAGWASAVDSGTTVTVTDGSAVARTDASQNTGGVISAVVDTQGADFALISVAEAVTGSQLTISAAALTLITDHGNIAYPGVVYQTGGTLLIRADEIVGDGNFNSAVWWKNGECSVFAKRIEAGYYAVYSDVSEAPTGDFYVSSDLITCTNQGPEAHGVIFCSGTNAAAAVWVDAKIIKATTTSGFAVQINATNKVYVHAQKLFGIVNCGGDAPLYLTADKIAPVGNYTTIFSLGGAGPKYIQVQHLDHADYTGIGIGTIGSTTSSALHIGNFTANSTSSGLTLTGNIRLGESQIDMTAGTNKTAVTIGNGAPVITGCRLIGTGTGKDIAVSSGSVSVIGGSGSGTGGAFVTSGTVNVKLGGLGTMASQAASGVAITGGTIAGVSSISLTQAAASQALKIVGTGYSGGTDASHGLAILLGYNASGNRQAWFGSSDDLGSTSNYFLRFIGGATVQVDAIRGDGGVGSGVAFPNGLSIGGAVVTKMMRTATASLDYPSIAANSEETLTVSVAGVVAATTPGVQLGWSAALPDGVTVKQAWVSANDTVSIRVRNHTGSGIDPGAVTVRVVTTEF